MTRIGEVGTRLQNLTVKGRYSDILVYWDISGIFKGIQDFLKIISASQLISHFKKMQFFGREILRNEGKLYHEI